MICEAMGSSENDVPAAGGYSFRTSLPTSWIGREFMNPGSCKIPGFHSYQLPVPSMTKVICSGMETSMPMLIVFIDPGRFCDASYRDILISRFEPILVFGLTLKGLASICRVMFCSAVNRKASLSVLVENDTIYGKRHWRQANKLRNPGFPKSHHCDT